VYKFDDFLELGGDASHGVDPPTPDDTACIMYTSGTTGEGPILTRTVLPLFAPLAESPAALPLSHFLSPLSLHLSPPLVSPSASSPSLRVLYAHFYHG
jgi:hypothetical protein